MCKFEFPVKFILSFMWSKCLPLPIIILEIPVFVVLLYSLLFLIDEMQDWMLINSKTIIWISFLSRVLWTGDVMFFFHLWLSSDAEVHLRPRLSAGGLPGGRGRLPVCQGSQLWPPFQDLQSDHIDKFHWGLGRSPGVYANACWRLQLYADPTGMFFVW